MNSHLIKFSPLDFNPDKMNHNVIKEGNRFYVSEETFGKVPLYGDTQETAIVECSTCHDGHGKKQFPDLNIIENSESQICRICHLNYF